MLLRVLPTSGDKRYYMKVVRLLKLFGSGGCMYRKSVELCCGQQDGVRYLFDGRLIDVCPEGF